MKVVFRNHKDQNFKMLIQNHQEIYNIFHFKIFILHHNHNLINNLIKENKVTNIMMKDKCQNFLQQKKNHMKGKVNFYNNQMFSPVNKKILLKNLLIQVDFVNHNLKENQINNIIFLNRNFIHHIHMHYHKVQQYQVVMIHI